MCFAHPFRKIKFQGNYEGEGVIFMAKGKSKKDIKNKSSSLALLSMILGIISIFLGLIPVLGWLLVLAAIITGIVALSRCLKTGQRGKGKAITGIVLGGIMLILNILIFYAVVMAAFFALPILGAASVDGTATFSNWLGCDVESGFVVTENRIVEDFTGVSVSESIILELVQGDDKSVVVQADENFIDNVRTEVIDGVLIVEMTEDCMLWTTKPVVVKVSTPKIDYIKASESATLKGKSVIAADVMTIKSLTSANVEMSLLARELYVRSSTSSDVDLMGRSESLDLRASTSSEVDVFKLPVKIADVGVSTSASVEVFASDYLNATAHTSGRINYWGEPELDIDVATSGRVVQSS